MMAKKDKDKNPKKLSKKALNNVTSMDAIIDKMIMSLDDNYVSALNLNEKNAEFKHIINDELDMAKGISGGTIVDFARSVFQNNTKDTKKENDDDVLYKFITQNSGDIYRAYTDKNRISLSEARDLQFITRMVPSLGQAVSILLNHITSSDDLSGLFTRSLDVGFNLDSTDADTVKSAIEQFERDNNLLFKLKNICYKGALEQGLFYAYAISYSDLFTEFSKTKAKSNSFNSELQKDRGLSGAFEYVSEGVSYDHIDEECGCISATVALEECDIREINNLLPNAGVSSSNMSFKKSLRENISDVYTLESGIPSEVLEDMSCLEGVSGLPDSEIGKKLRKTFRKSAEKANQGNLVSDGVVSINSKPEKFDTTGTYIRFIEPDSIIPIDVLNETIGYLYIETKAKKKENTTAKFVAGELITGRKTDAVEKIASLLSEKILQKFSAKFVAENSKFKSLIADCIISHGVVNTEYKIQFIAPENIIPFIVNPDKKGNGQSVLKNSLFPAKLLTAYQLKKNLNYINKSGDKTIAHVRGGQTDLNRNNHIMRVVRELQESNITFGDMMADYSMMFHKYAADNSMVMPMGRGGNRLIEFEKMDGQNIDMNTEYEKNLENLAITATGISPLIVEQYNQADYAKSYTTAHIGLAGYVAGIQSDFEGPTTRLYSIIIENLDIDDRLKQQVLPNFEFKLPRPKSLAAVNNVEAMNNATQVADTYVNLKHGEQSDNEIETKRRNAVKFAIVKDLTPFIDWDHLDDVALEALTNVDNIQNSTGTGSGETGIAGPGDF